MKAIRFLEIIVILALILFGTFVYLMDRQTHAHMNARIEILIEGVTDLGRDVGNAMEANIKTIDQMNRMADLDSKFLEVMQQIRERVATLERQ
jgi:hypothetical protein